MGNLKVLPAQIANMIAAGEVVQRPASVVKELMENAVDAGADRISVVITDAGRTLIQVIDNGCGMSPSDAVLCFERHATSKIATADDLSRILTYGFRGEALASIAAVSEVTLKTRRAQDDTATQVSITDFNTVKTSSTSAPAGSSFSIRNLFYNTPARRKFLKSDNVEFKHIVEEFTRIAIPHPEIAFTLSHNGREVYVLHKAKSLKFRITDLLGSNVVGDIVDLSSETAMVKLQGFVGRPESARKTLGNQYFFVGSRKTSESPDVDGNTSYRYFRSNYLHKAVMKAYDKLMPEGMTPSYIIFIEIDPSSVDVNIHPTKTEIKFEDDNILFQILYACVHETLGRNSFGASIDFDTEGSVQMPVIGHSFSEYKGGDINPDASFDPNYNPFDPDASAGTAAWQGGASSVVAAWQQGAGSAAWQGGANSAVAAWQQGAAPEQATEGRSPMQGAARYSQYVNGNQNYGALFEQTQMGKAFMVQGKFIACQSASGMLLVNVRRAWERILFERTLKSLSGELHVTQTALFPVQVQVGVQQRLLFDEHADMLSKLGFDISPFGTDTVAVNGVPEGYSCDPLKVQQMISDLTLILSDNHGALPAMMQQSMAEKMATLGAMNADSPGSPESIRQFLDTLFACDNAEYTSNGRRITSVLSVEELEKRF